MSYLTALAHWDSFLNTDENFPYSIPLELFEEEFGYDPRDEG